MEIAFDYYYCYVVLALDSQHKGTSSTSIKSPVADEEGMRTCCLQCFDADDWVAERTSTL